MLSHHSRTPQRWVEPNLILLPSSMGMLVGSPVGLLSTEWAGLVGRTRHKDAWPSPPRRWRSPPLIAQGPVTDHTEPIPQSPTTLHLACRNIPSVFPTPQAPLSPLISQTPRHPRQMQSTCACTKPWGCCFSGSAQETPVIYTQASPSALPSRKQEIPFASSAQPLFPKGVA